MSKHLLSLEDLPYSMLDVEFPFSVDMPADFVSATICPCKLYPFCAYTVCHSMRGRQRLELNQSRIVYKERRFGKIKI